MVEVNQPTNLRKLMFEERDNIKDYKKQFLDEFGIHIPRTKAKDLTEILKKRGKA